MTERREAIEAAARSLAQGVVSIYEGTTEDAARRAYTPGGPSVSALVERIQRLRDAA